MTILLPLQSISDVPDHTTGRAGRVIASDQIIQDNLLKGNNFPLNRIHLDMKKNFTKNHTSHSFVAVIFGNRLNSGKFFAL